MNIVIFGLTITSSWGNGHATIWRGLCKALGRNGHKIFFFEKDVPYYAGERDGVNIPGTEVILYSSWDEIKYRAADYLKDADAGIVTSYCPDGIPASELVFNSQALKIFYDLDTPVTIKKIDEGERPVYLHPSGLGEFDLVLSYTGGSVLDILTHKLGAKNVAPLYGCADPETHFPVEPVESYRSALSYLGTYAADRQKKLIEFFIKPALELKEKRFIAAGSLYPWDTWWPENVYYLQHVPPPEHPAFYCSSDFTLNITRGVMADNGYCPSGRLFEAAACGVPIISDNWKGLDQFFIPGKEIVIVSDSNNVISALNLADEERKNIREAAMERILAWHTCYKRAEEFEKIIENVYSGKGV